MSTNANQYIVNIVPLQGIVTGITSGSDTTKQITSLQSDIANIQTMVDYTTGTISADYIQSFTPGNTIQIRDNINLSSVSLLSNNLATSIGNTSSISFSSNSYISLDQSTISFVSAGNDILKIASTGTLQYTRPSVNISSGIDISGYLYVSENAYVKTLYQTSDRNQKTNIVKFSTCLDKVLELQPYSFNWKNTGESDLGFIAQDVNAKWPELTVNDTSIAYSRFIPLLLEGIRELRNRVSTLEAKA
jgi:Chaperone of endosialidase